MKNFILSVALLATIFTCSYAASIEDTTKDALIAKGNYDLVGTFVAHDFANAEDAFDWAFTLTNGTSYQLQGKSPSDTDVFGWDEVTITTPEPAWYMFALGEDIDGDDSQKFDWVLLSTNMKKKAAYKLKGEQPNGTFDYSGKLDIDYSINGNNITMKATSSTTTPVNSTYDYNADGGATLPLSSNVINTRQEVAAHLETLKDNKEAFNTYINIFTLNLLNLDAANSTSAPIKRALSSDIPSYAPVGEQQKMLVSVKNGNIDYSSYILKGDINNDYSVDMSDINILIDAIYNDYSSSMYDVNLDGLVNLDDIIFTTARLLTEIKYFDFYTVDGEKLAITTRDVDMPKTISYSGDSSTVMVVAKDVNMASSFETGLSDIDDVWYKQDGWEVTDTVITDNITTQASTRTTTRETVFKQREILEQVVTQALTTSANSDYLCGWNFYTQYIYRGIFLEQDRGISEFNDIFSNVDKTIKASFAKADMGNPPHELYHTKQYYAYEAGQKIGRTNEVSADRISYKDLLMSKDGKTVTIRYLVQAYSVLFISQATHTIGGTIGGSEPFKGELTLHRDGPGKEDDFDIDVNGRTFTKNNVPYGEYGVNAKTECGCEVELSTHFIFDESSSSISIEDPTASLKEVYLSLDVKDEEQKKIEGAEVEIVADECATEAFSDSATTDSDGNVRFEDLKPAIYKVFVDGKLAKTILVCGNTNTVVNVIETPLWKFHVNYYFYVGADKTPDHYGGSMTVKNFPVNFEGTGPQNLSLVWVDDTSITEDGVKVSFTGDLSYYSDIRTLDISFMSGELCININALFLEHMELHVKDVYGNILFNVDPSISSACNTTTGMNNFNGNLPPEWESNTVDGIATYWERIGSDKETYKLSFTPCTNSECTDENDSGSDDFEAEFDSN